MALNVRKVSCWYWARDDIGRWVGWDGRRDGEMEYSCGFESEVNFCQDSLAVLDITSTCTSKGHLPNNLDIAVTE